jgi:hypothetical protein
MADTPAQAPAAPAAEPVQTRVRLKDGVFLSEWNQWLPPGTEVVVHSDLLTDARLVGKFEIVQE